MASAALPSESGKGVGVLAQRVGGFAVTEAGLGFAAGGDVGPDGVGGLGGDGDDGEGHARINAGGAANVRCGRSLRVDRWESASTPTLVVTGAKSEAFLHRGAEALASALPDARVRKLERANHSAVVAAPRKLAALITPFLDEG